MALYSICSLLIEADSLPHSYAPFLVTNECCQNPIDLRIKRIPTKYSTNKLYKLADLAQVIIWKEKIGEDDQRWIFEARNGMCIFYVDEEFQYAEYWRSSILGYLERDVSGALLSSFFQLIIESKLVKTGFLSLHSACIELDGVAYAFAGPSGVGKSSRANKWCELLSAELISGDRPTVDTGTGKVYGVPWDGKEAVYRNCCSPLAAIFKVVRSKTTVIKVMSEDEKLQFLCEQIFFPLWDVKLAGLTIHALRRLLTVVPIYELHCDITDKSTYESYNLITKIINGTRRDRK